MSIETSIYSAELPFEGLGQDRLFAQEFGDGTVWAGVIDGAFSPDDQAPNGADYANTLRDAVLDWTRDEPDIAPTDVLHRAIAEVVGRLGLPRASEPAAAVGIVRWSPFDVCLALLGRVSLVLLDDEGEQVLTDDRLSGVGAAVRERYRARLADGCGYDEEHDLLLRQLREQQLKARNRDPGYWIAADDPAAAEEALTLESVAPISRVVLATDGASAAVTTYGLQDSWAELADRVEADPTRFCQRIRTAELSDKDGRRWPRSRPHDDIAALVLARTFRP
jgi:hypothetical protein